MNQYIIQGQNCYDPQTFLYDTEQAITNMTRNRQTKVKLILNCEMKKVDVNAGETIMSNKKLSLKMLELI